MELATFSQAKCTESIYYSKNFNLNNYGVYFSINIFVKFPLKRLTAHSSNQLVFQIPLSDLGGTDEWYNELINSLISSMPERISELIENAGGCIAYWAINFHLF